MRLLNVHTSLFEEHNEDGAPAYAILSHTWGSDEVSYAAYSDSIRARERSSVDPRIQTIFPSEKIRYACRAARRDELEWIWIDTCCIDKDSSAELSEAINSMYRWYSNAQVCYAYLSDTPSDGFLEAFHKSRWFTRGWTLQELLAPGKIKFWSSDWSVFGWSENLADLISTRTGIPEALLQKRTELDEYTVAQRMSWAAHRETTRIEDRAYSLMGMFDVNMPLLYGEGTRAFQRLQEEILRTSDDQSILAWGPRLPIRAIDGLQAQLKDIGAHLGAILAPSPSSFADCGEVVGIPGVRRLTDFTLTNKGLDMRLPMISSGDCHVGLLACREQQATRYYLGILLARKNELYRWHTILNDGETASTVVLTDPDLVARAEMQEITIRNPRKRPKNGQPEGLSSRRGSVSSLEAAQSAAPVQQNIQIHWEHLEKLDYEIRFGATEYSPTTRPMTRQTRSPSTFTVSTSQETHNPLYILFVFGRKDDEKAEKPRIFVWVDIPFLTHVPFTSTPQEAAAGNVQFLLDEVWPHRDLAQLRTQFGRSKYKLATKEQEWTRALQLSGQTKDVDHAEITVRDKILKAAAHRYDILDQWVLHLTLNVVTAEEARPSLADEDQQKLFAQFQSWNVQRTLSQLQDSGRHQDLRDLHGRPTALPHIVPKIDTAYDPDERGLTANQGT